MAINTAALMREIERVAAYLEEPSANAPAGLLDTRERAVRPLLQHLGYTVDDIVAPHDGVGTSSPDYTLLPGTDYAWFVKVRDWSHRLAPEDAICVVHHAERQGSRWAVLTNGRFWHLYDAIRTTVQASRRAIATACLDEPDQLCRLLQRISKQSVVSGGLSDWADRRRLDHFLYHQLTRSSELTRLLKDYCAEHGFYEADDMQVVQYFKRALPTPIRHASTR